MWTVGSWVISHGDPWGSLRENDIFSHLPLTKVSLCLSMLLLRLCGIWNAAKVRSLHGEFTGLDASKLHSQPPSQATLCSLSLSLHKLATPFA